MGAYERKEAMVIVNPLAHKVPSRRRLDEADRWLKGQGWRVEWRRTEGRGEATELAREAAQRELPLLFVVGGDGTLNEAANGLAGSETALAVIRAGTVNIWAREIGVPKKPLAAVRAAVAGERRRIDLGRAQTGPRPGAGDRYFLLMAGYGLDGAIGRRVHPGLKSRFGAVIYALAALQETFRYQSSAVTLSFDGERQAAEVLMLVAGNTRNYAGLVEITPEALADDALLDVCVYQGKGTLDIILHALRTLLRRHLRSKKVLYRKARRLEMAWEEALPVQLDGDAIEESPTVVEVVPEALWVAVPRGVSSPLFRR